MPVLTTLSNGDVPNLAAIEDSSVLPAGASYDFEQVFKEHAARVWRALRTMGVPAHQVEDAAQEVFIIVSEKLGEFEGRAKLSTWIYAITYRVGSNYRAKARRQPRLASLEDTDLSMGETPEQHLSGKEAARFVENFCAQLEDGMRDVFVLCLLEQQPSVDVAAMLGINTNTVYSRVRLLRESLRAALAQHHRVEEVR
jgi:RNA polymerase sigma-70 factor (ECF subfamily)